MLTLYTNSQKTLVILVSEVDNSSKNFSTEAQSTMRKTSRLSLIQRLWEVLAATASHISCKTLVYLTLVSRTRSKIYSKINRVSIFETWKSVCTREKPSAT